jgi:hypothetical protein
MSRPDLSFTQVATGDLDVTIVSQLLPANFPLSDEFEPSPVNVIAFDAPFWRGGLWKQDLEHAPGNVHHPLISNEDPTDGSRCRVLRVLSPMAQLAANS